MKVFVTGADGFIGSHLVELLVEQGYEVTAFCMYNSLGSCGWIDNIPKEKKKFIKVLLGDIRDPSSIKDGMKGCDIVFHLASLIAIPYSYIAQSSYVDTNIHGTLNTLQEIWVCQYSFIPRHLKHMVLLNLFQLQKTIL